MATLYYLDGFSTAGTNQTMTFTIAGFAATVTSGTYAYASFASLLTSQYTKFGDAFKAAADTAGGGPYTVTYSTTTHLFTISRATNFTVAWSSTAAGLRTRAAMGFAADLSGASTYTSTIRPLYVTIPLMEGRSDMSGVYEPDDIVEEAVSDGGTSYAVSKQTTELWSDWSQAMEAKAAPSGSITTGGVATLGAAVFTASISATFPGAWQAMIKRVRGQHPIGVYESATGNTLHKLRADGAYFKPERYATDYDGLWSLPFRTRHLGVLP